MKKLSYKIRINQNFTRNIKKMTNDYLILIYEYFF